MTIGLIAALCFILGINLGGVVVFAITRSAGSKSCSCPVRTPWDNIPWRFDVNWFQGNRNQ